MPIYKQEKFPRRDNNALSLFNVKLNPTYISSSLVYCQGGMRTMIEVEECSRPPPVMNLTGELRRFNLAIQPITNTGNNIPDGYLPTILIHFVLLEFCKISIIHNTRKHLLTFESKTL